MTNPLPTDLAEAHRQIETLRQRLDLKDEMEQLLREQIAMLREVLDSVRSQAQLRTAVNKAAIASLGEVADAATEVVL